MSESFQKYMRENFQKIISIIFQNTPHQKESFFQKYRLGNAKIEGGSEKSAGNGNRL